VIDTRKLIERILAARSPDDALVGGWCLQLLEEVRARNPERVELALTYLRMNDPRASQLLQELIEELAS